jgi:hypothetical protein
VNTSKKTKTMGQSLFVGGDFEESQFLYLIPFIHGYLQKSETSEIIFEHQPSKRILESQEIANILRRYQVRYLISNRFRKLKTIYRFFIFGLGFKSFYLAVKSYRRKYLDDFDWYTYQLIHSIIDQARISSKDGKIKPSLLSIYKASLVTVASSRTAKQLVEDSFVHTAILGHTVYRSRAMLAEFRTHSHVKIIAQAANTLYTLASQSDRSWSILTNQEAYAFTSQLDTLAVSNYWAERLEGRAKYFDAANAYHGGGREKEAIPNNLVFLHVFRDSPFNHLDRDRIFFDYVEWMIQTLDILESSREAWLIRAHPSAERWGENQERWLSSISRQLKKGNLPSNVFLDLGGTSNLSLLKRAKRVITYHGSVHLEAGCLGKKPIVISETTVSSIRPDLIHKPGSLEAYASLMLIDSESSEFQLSSEGANTYKSLLYIKENLLGFGENLGSLPLYRGDPGDAFERNFVSMLSKTPELSSMFEFVGREFSNGLSRTVNFNFLSKFTAIMNQS